MSIDWRPGIGDPTVTGWITVLAYFVAAALSFRAARMSQFAGRHWQIDSGFWFAAMLLMVALGINKQLDLQSLLTELLRGWAKAAGWYEDRRRLQGIAIGLIAAFALTCAVLLCLLLRKAALAVRLAALGLCLVLAFVVIRAASFHKVDALIGRELWGISWNALLELPGILVTALAAMRYAQLRRSRLQSATKTAARPHGNTAGKRKNTQHR